MKTLRFILMTMALLTAGLALGQTTPLPTRAISPPPAPDAQAGYFDLDFPGGSPRDLVDAIQKALGHEINAIVPDEYANFRLPALKMKSVDVPHLFQALEAASQRSEMVTTGTYYGGGQAGGYSSVQQMTTSYGFRRASNDNLPNAVWYFSVQKPNFQASNKVCKFYPLSGYLEQGFSVDDITTAIQTGARMLDEPGPAISFHKDTKLLIAVGEPRKLEIIDAALSALRGQTPPTEGPVKPSHKTTPDKK